MQNGNPCHCTSPPNSPLSPHFSRLLDTVQFSSAYLYILLKLNEHGALEQGFFSGIISYTQRILLRSSKWSNFSQVFSLKRSTLQKVIMILLDWFEYSWEYNIFFSLSKKTSFGCVHLTSCVYEIPRRKVSQPIMIALHITKIIPLFPSNVNAFSHMA